MRDSQERRLVADSLQRNPQATWMYTCPIKMCVALYIERDRSHDTPCTSPMGIFYRGEFVHTSASTFVRTSVCVHTCIIHMYASREAGSNGNQRARIFHRDMIWIVCVYSSICFWFQCNGMHSGQLIECVRICNFIHHKIPLKI